MSREAQVIAEIPEDIVGSPGKILTSDVYGVANGHRKKRCEIALAIDKQSVNIYDIRQPRLVSSYAVSPEAKFTCPPWSLRYRAANGAPTHRLTFCSLQLPKARLYRFYEALNPTLSLANQIATKFIDLQEDNNPVVHLETISGVAVDGNENPIDCLLAIHQNGRIAYYAEDLEKELSSSSISTTEKQQVILATPADAAQVKRGLLKHREDVLASLGHAESDQAQNLLVILTYSGLLQNRSPKLSLQILEISKPSVRHHVRGLQPREVYSVDVPTTNDFKLGDSKFAIYLPNGNLYQQTPEFLTVFDMSDLPPKIVHEVVVNESDVSSFLRLSSHTLAIGRQSSYSLVSLPYCSVQGDSGADVLATAEDGELRLASYFDSLKTIVAMKGRSLITLRLPKPSPGNPISRKRKREGTLADSIGRVSYAKRNLLFSNEAPDVSMDNLGALSTISKDEAWEIQKLKWADPNSQTLKDISDAMVKEFDMQNPKANFSIDQQKISYLLSKSFTVQRRELAEDERLNKVIYLKITGSNRKIVFKWLMGRGYLTRYRVEDSLRQNGSLLASETLPPAAIIEALSNEDRSLQLLASLLSSQIPLSPTELISALAIVIQQHHTSKDSTSTSPAINNPNNKNYTLPTSTYQHLINLLLTRLSLLPHSSITTALRTHLPIPTLLSLIDTLRLQIATAGWVTPYDNDPNTPPTPLPTIPNDHLANTTHLLNSTIDAIGTGGWILGASPSASSINHNHNNNNSQNHNNQPPNDTDDNLAQTANTLSYMNAEVAAALEGIQEAVYLQGMLNEVLLCGKDALAKPQPPQSHKPTTLFPPRKNKAQTVEKEITLATVEDKAGVGNALPLSLKLVRTVSRRRVGAGGELKERRRGGVERLKSQMVGEYSFERLRV